MAASLEKKASTTLLSRYQQVIMVLIKYGFEDILAHPPLSRLVPSSEKLVPFRDGKPVFAYTRYERVRMVCEELGTTFIKFAQIAANRPDVLPEELIEELTTFHSNAPMVPATTMAYSAFSFQASATNRTTPIIFLVSAVSISAIIAISRS